MSVRDLAAGIRGDDSGSPYRHGQVIGFDFDSQPPVLFIDEDERPMRFVGLPTDYTYFDTVIWVMHSGAPLVVGRLPHMGGDLEDWHLVGTGSEPAFQNSWVNFGGTDAVAGFYMQPDGWVRLKGLVKDGTSTATIFTLPDGYRPPVTIPFTSISASAACTIEVSTTGTVIKTSGGNNSHVSLAGITFPSQWNREQWLIPEMEPSWSRGAITNPTAEIFMRDDGWCWMRGAVDGSNGTRIFVMPLETRTVLTHILACDDVAGLGWTRLDLLYKGVLDHVAGTALSAQLGGKTWFARKGGRAFISPTFLNSWANLGSLFQTAGYYKDHLGVVHLEGAVTGSNTNPIFNLPAGYRPLEQHIYFTLTEGHDDSRVDVLANGDVKRLVGTNGYLSLNGVSFRAEQ